MTRRWWFWPIYGLLLIGLVAAGSEYVVSTSVPAWPARELRPIPIEGLTANVKTVFADSAELVPSYNDWAVRDRPRSIARPPTVRFRSVLVGDSFLEGYYIPAPLAGLVERRWLPRDCATWKRSTWRSPQPVPASTTGGSRKWRWRWTRTWWRCSSTPATT